LLDVNPPSCTALPAGGQEGIAVACVCNSLFWFWSRTLCPYPGLRQIYKNIMHA